MCSPSSFLELVGAACTAAACAVGSLGSDLGDLGAAAGLAAVVRAALCLEHQILPAACSIVAGESVLAETQYWLRNRADGPRRACVCVTSLGGSRAELIVEELDDERAQPSLELRSRSGGAGLGCSQSRPLTSPV